MTGLELRLVRHSVSDSQQADARHKRQWRETKQQRYGLQEHQKTGCDHRGLTQSNRAPNAQDRRQEDYALQGCCRKCGLGPRPDIHLVLCAPAFRSHADRKLGAVMSARAE